MNRTGEAVLIRWHRMLGLKQQSPPSWYRERIREELYERRTAKTWLERLSETSDVLFSISRARYDGFPVRTRPSFSYRSAIPYTYMMVKYTSRWKFYQTAALLCKSPCHRSVCEVVNPQKDKKLAEVARRHQIDPAQFRSVGGRLRKIWPLIP